MSSTDDIAGVFDAIETEQSAHDPVDQVNETAEAEGSESTTEAENKTEDVESQATDQSDEGQTQGEATNETDAPSQDSETSEQNTETQTEADTDWKAGLPPDPGEFTLEAPQPDENGLIDPTAYGDFLRAQIRHEGKVEEYNARVITATFDTVEKILPEIKDNDAYQTAIRNTFYNTLSGEDTVKLAKEFRASIDKIAGESKAAGAQNAKTSITIQKSAAVETGASQKGDIEEDKVTTLQKRIKRGDDEAFAELVGMWEENGSLK